MLAILTTHPIQYQVPLFQALARDSSVPFEVWFMSDHASKQSYDLGFEKTFAWDFDMLEGYPHRFLSVNRNASVDFFNHVRLAEPLRDRLREKKVKHVWMLGWQVRAYWQAVWQTHAAGVHVWMRGESNDLALTPAWKKPVKRLLLGQLFQRVNEFLYIGEANRRFYQGFKISDERLHPAPYFVDNDRFARQADVLAPQRAKLRREWNIPEDAFCFVFAGKFVGKKRPLDLVAAARDAGLRNLNRPVHLLFVGSGELGREIRDACQVVFDAENAGPTNRVHVAVNGHGPPASFAGFLNQTEISKAYVAADCLVLPSDHRETWGLVVNEALASGLPCVVSDACGCGEDLIAPLDPAYRFRVGEPSSLTSALRAAIEKPVTSGKLREQANKFNLSLSVNTIRRLYHAT